MKRLFPPPAMERSDRNVLRVIEHFTEKPPGTPEAKRLHAELLAEAERRGIAGKRSEDIPQPPLPPMPWEVHKDCTWREVPPCVYCVEHGERLYHGSLPEERDPVLAAKRKACSHLDHVIDDDGHEHGQGFYWLCADCGFKGWYE